MRYEIHRSAGVPVLQEPDLFDYEDEPMTLIVGMIGSDGWLLASDRTRAEYGNASLRVCSAVKKIVMNESWGACAFFGDDVAVVASEQFAANAPNTELQKVDRQWLFSFGNTTWEQMNKNRPAVFHTSYRARGIFLMFQNRLDTFWTLHIGPQSIAHEVKDKFTEGDINNSARFFLDRCYHRDMTVRELSLLATHFITTGAALSPSFIDGLDIVICQNEKMRWLTESEIAELQKQSHSIDKKIGRFFAYPRNGGKSTPKA